MWCNVCKQMIMFVNNKVKETMEVEKMFHVFVTLQPGIRLYDSSQTIVTLFIYFFFFV